MKKILIIGGNENQIPMIQRAKALGLFVIVADFRDNVPGIELADKFYQVNALDIDAMVDVATKEQIDGIITNSEPLFMVWSEIADRLHLPCLSKELTSLYKNKFLMRDFCKKIGIPHPQYRLCNTIDDAKSFFRMIGGKCIIKPLDNSASRGVFSINSEEDLDEHFAESLAASSKMNHHVLMEQYITGTEFTVDAIKTGARNHCLAISEKKHYVYNENVACQLLFDNRSVKFDYDLLRRTNDMLVEASGMPFGVTHAEYKYQDGVFYLIEIQARTGGCFIGTEIVPYISGIDEYTEQIKWAMGKENFIQWDYNQLSNRCAVLHFFDAPKQNGIVKDILGLDYLNSIKGQLIYKLNFNIGDTIDEAKDDEHRIGYYILKAKDRVELEGIMNNINDKFQIII